MLYYSNTRMSTTGNWPYPDGQINADGCRRPTLRYADSHVLAVGVPWPSGYHELSRRHPSAYICRRPSCEHGDSSRRHNQAVGIPVGRRPRPCPAANVVKSMSTAWTAGRRHISSCHVTDPRRTVHELSRRLPSAYMPRQRSAARRPPPKTWPSLCRRHSRRHR